MHSVRINELSNHSGATVTVRGWVTHLRSSRKGRVHRAARWHGDPADGAREERRRTGERGITLPRLTQETSLSVTGEVRPDARAPGGFELGIADLSIIGESPLDYPIQPKEHGIDFLLDNRTFWLRSPRQVAIARIRNELEQATHDFYYGRGFLRVDTPILTAAIGERSGLFSTEYFEEGNAYLAQTGQLYGEAAAAAFGKIYTFGPTFRAEEVENAPAPHRVLDDRTGGRVQRHARQHETAGGLHHLHGRARARAARCRAQGGRT